MKPRVDARTQAHLPEPLTVPERGRGRCELFPGDEGELEGTTTIRATTDVDPDGQSFTADYTIEFGGEGAGRIAAWRSTLPTQGCGPLVGFPAGAIALVHRGTCPDLNKVLNAQASGAAAVIVINNVPGAPVMLEGTSDAVYIPAVMVSQSAGATINAGLPAEGVVRADT